MARETYPNARRPEWPTAEFIVGNPGWIPPLILQKAAACRVALHIWRLCRPGGLFFVTKEFGSGGFTAAVAATNGLIGQLGPR